jgi:uncharacterized membrane protein YheB (UPF0754 family)
MKKPRKLKIKSFFKNKPDYLPASDPKTIGMALDDLDIPSQVPRGMIEKLGLGPEVIRMRKSGLTYQDIATQLSLEVGHVSSFIGKYRNMTEAQRVDVHRRSVFDVAQRLQEVFEELTEVLSRVKDNNADLEIKAADKLLKCLSMAGDLMEKVQIYEENKRFREILLDLLDQEAPGIKAKALRKLAEYKSEHLSLLRPL